MTEHKEMLLYDVDVMNLKVWRLFGRKTEISDKVQTTDSSKNNL